MQEYSKGKQMKYQQNSTYRKRESGRKYKREKRNFTSIKKMVIKNINTLCKMIGGHQISLSRIEMRKTHRVK